MERGGLWTTQFIVERAKRSIRAAFASPLILISIIVSSSSIVSMLEHYSLGTPGSIGALVVSIYRQRIHSFLDLLTQFVALAVPTLLKDGIVLWVALSSFAVRFLSGTPVGRTATIYLSQDDAVDYGVSNQDRIAVGT